MQRARMRIRDAGHNIRSRSGIESGDIDIAAMASQATHTGTDGGRIQGLLRDLCHHGVTLAKITNHRTTDTDPAPGIVPTTGKRANAVQ